MSRSNDYAYKAEPNAKVKKPAAQEVPWRRFGGVITLSLMAITSGCATVVLAPGAARVRLTMDPVDVSGCTPVGNVAPLPNESVSMAKTMFRNRVIGFGGNTGLITKSIFAEPIEGIAYRCSAGSKQAAGK